MTTDLRTYGAAKARDHIRAFLKSGMDRVRVDLDAQFQPYPDPRQVANALSGVIHKDNVYHVDVENKGADGVYLVRTGRY